MRLFLDEYAYFVDIFANKTINDSPHEYIHYFDKACAMPDSSSQKPAKLLLDIYPLFY